MTQRKCKHCGKEITNCVRITQVYHKECAAPGHLDRMKDYRYLHRRPYPQINATPIIRSICCMARIKKSGRGNWFCKECFNLITKALHIIKVIERATNTKRARIEVVIL